MKAKDSITEDELWAAYDAHKEDLGHVGELYAEAKAAGDRTRVCKLLEYSRVLRAQFYSFLEEHLDVLPLDLQTALCAIRQRREAAAKG